jgi:hypothetical protein
MDWSFIIYLFGMTGMIVLNLLMQKENNKKSEQLKKLQEYTDALEQENRYKLKFQLTRPVDATLLKAEWGDLATYYKVMVEPELIHAVATEIVEKGLYQTEYYEADDMLYGDVHLKIIKPLQQWRKKETK